MRVEATAATRSPGGHDAGKVERIGGADHNQRVTGRSAPDLAEMFHRFGQGELLA